MFKVKSHWRQIGILICKRGNHEISQNLYAFSTVPILKTRNKRTEWMELGATTGVNSWEWLRDLDLLIFRDFSFCILKGGCTRYEVEPI